MSQRAGRGEQVSPRNTTSSQRLMPVPGRSQRRSRGELRLSRSGARHRRVSSSRCQTLTGPRSSPRRSSASASAMATERWNPPVQPMAMVRRRLALGLVGRDREREEVVEVARGTAA